MEWISVKDRLPEDLEHVLVFVKKSYVINSKYLPANHQNVGVFDDGTWWDASIVKLINGEVTHWQPLPESPKAIS